LRVISGTRKGHKLKTLKGQDVRPTEDRIKESLFNIIGQIDRESIVLDAFAGSGSIGIEFLSRGARHGHFADKSSRSIGVIRENLRHTKFLDNSTVYHMDSLDLLTILKKRNISFDYIYIDPPFGQGLIHGILEKISQVNILKDDGKIIVEHESKLVLEERYLDFSMVDKRKYGSKTLTFYEKII